NTVFNQVKNVYDRYNNSEENLTISDVANELENIEDLPKQLTTAIDVYMEELRDDFALSGRGDIDNAEEAFMAVVENYLNSTPKTEATQLHPDNNIMQDTTGLDKTIYYFVVDDNDKNNPKTIGQILGHSTYEEAVEELNALNRKNGFPEKQPVQYEKVKRLNAFTEVQPNETIQRVEGKNTIVSYGGED